MANLPEVDQFDTGVYQLETTDPALAGANGVMNTPPKSLVNRTRFLLNRLLDGALSFVADSGVKNAIVASFPQPIGALIDGMQVSFRVAVTNDSTTTLQLTNTGGATIPTLPLWGGDHVALAGGELPAGTTVCAKLNLSLNGGTGAWVITSVTGGYARILTPASGDSSNRAANMAAVFNATDGMATVNVGVGADIVLTAAQCGCAILKLTGTPTAAINLVLPAGQTGQWVINNQQGGTDNITVKPSGGTGVVLPQATSPTIVVSDGTTASFASAQAAQASFSILPFTGITGTTLTVPGGYTPGSIFIEKNGGVLEPADFVATTSPTITLTKPAISTDVFNVYRFTSFDVANALQKSGDAMAGPLILQAATQASDAVQFGQLCSMAGESRDLFADLEANGTSLTFTASRVIVETSDGLPVRLSNFNQTVSTTATGIGGVVGAALSASGYAAVYAAWNPTTLQQGAFLVNANAHVPDVAAAPPSGWVSTGLISVWRLGTTTQFLQGLQRGRSIEFSNTGMMSSTSTVSAWTAFSLATTIPPNAKSISGSLTAGGIDVINAFIHTSGSPSGFTYKECLFTCPNIASPGGAVTVPFQDLTLAVAQTVYWVSGATGGTSLAVASSVAEYKI